MKQRPGLMKNAVLAAGLSSLCVLSMTSIGAQQRTQDGAASANESVLVAWSEATDDFGVGKRTLNNKMEMMLGTSGTAAAYIVRSLDGEWLEMAPGNYGGLQLLGRGGPPKVNPKTGSMINGKPDPTFYAVFGVGSRLELPDEWVTIFGVRVRGGEVIVQEDGLRFVGSEIEKTK